MHNCAFCNNEKYQFNKNKNCKSIYTETLAGVLVSTSPVAIKVVYRYSAIFSYFSIMKI